MAASSSTSAAANPINKSYEIFINHRGVDVKETFARSLYQRLMERGFMAFLDKGEMQPGYDFTRQIEEAIATATVHVAIFSPRYAESDWCLKELLMMLETGAPIIPVFYRVSPAQVRWQGNNGSYAQALDNRRNKRTREGTMRYDPEVIAKWRNALFQVANKDGFELETRDGEELQLELLDNLVIQLSERVNKLESLHVAKYPTGLDGKLKEFEERVLRQQQRCRSQRLGIWGLGGVGKTALAKEFFNRKKSEYKKSCFLFDVKTNADKGSLMVLQRELLKELFGLDNPLKNVDKGTGMLEKHIKRLRSSNAHDVDVDDVSNILVILDDVDHLNQVDALLPVDLPPGSSLLITSRNKRVLLGSKVEDSSIYFLTGLNDQDSQELFCSYAFSQTYPRPGFESLVDSFLKACEGLPLSLKVFGASLYERDISDWEDELRGLPREIEERLKIRYNSLDSQEQQIFLDIACFFSGKDRDTAISIWYESGWEGRRGFQNLQDKCLVEVVNKNTIRMHHHLIDLGRDVAEESSPRRVCRWTENTKADLFHQSPGTLRGIRMVQEGGYNSDTDDEDDTLVEPQRILKRLRILDTESSLFERIFRVKLQKLTWLCWRKCPHSFLPSWVTMKNLRFLQVSESSLNTLGEREGESQALLQLPACLEELRADECVQLKSIGEFHQSRKLRRLIVSGCSELEELPSMERLASLEVL